LSYGATNCDYFTDADIGGRVALSNPASTL